MTELVHRKSLEKVFEQTESKIQSETINDPFQNRHFNRMLIVVHNDRDMQYYNKKGRVECDVEFRNGTTKGSHTLFASNLIEMHYKLCDFFHELKGKEDMTNSTDAQ